MSKTLGVGGVGGAGVVAWLVFGAAWSCPAFGQQTNNHVLRAVPAGDGGVTVDGKLGEWDLSGEILCCYDLAKLEATHSVRVAAMYDAAGLYLAFHFKDRTPMVSHIRPADEPGGGWKADGAQVRIQADRALHVTSWYYTDGRQPAMSIHYGMWDEKTPDFRELDDALAAGAKEAFAADADGRGYVQEMMIPWKLITRDGRSLKAGDALTMGLELFWGSVKANDYPEHRYADLVNPQRAQREFFWTTPQAWGTVQLLDHGKLEPSPSIKLLADLQRQRELLCRTAGPVAIRYEIPADAGVTLAIEKADGTRVRNLIADWPRKAGKNVDYWDGADDAGRLVEPGDYRVRGLYHGEMDLLYEFAYGNPGNPPYDNSKGTGSWLSNHENPFAAAADGERVYLACPQAEGATSVLAADYEGRRQWGIGNISAGMMARHGQYLYMLVGGYCYQPSVPKDQVQIVRLLAATGKYAPFADGKSAHAIARIPADLADWPGFKPRRPEGELVAEHGFDADWCQRQTMGLAVAGGKLYASLYYQNQVIVVDPDKGEAIGQIALDRPAGLAADRAGTLYAISGKRLVKLAADNQWIDLVTVGLSAPVGLACDAGGKLYISDWGAAMCVKVFSPDGKLLRTIGKPGGRSLSGKYEPDGMFRPFGIAVDAKGRLWAAESDLSPRRVSVWDARTGGLLREFCGTTYYSAVGTQVNALNPRQAFVMGNVCELDWDKGLWRVTGTLSRPTTPQSLFDLAEWNAADVVRHDGRDLLVTSNQFVCCVSELRQWDAKPLAAMGSVYGLYRTGERWPELILKNLADPARMAGLKKKYPRVFTWLAPGYDGSGRDVSTMLGEPDVRAYFTWTDQNGDGLVQEGEIRFYNRKELGGPTRIQGMWRFGVGPDLTVYLPDSSDQGGPRQRLWKLPVKQWNQAGAPVYDMQDARLVVDTPVLTFPDSSVWTDPKGQTLLGQNPLMMFSPDGKLLWTYPNPWGGVHGSHTAPAAKRGRIIGPLFVLGSAQVRGGVGEVFCMGGNLGERYLMTTDGLYVAAILQDGRSAPESLPDEPRRGMSIAGSTAGGESFNGQFFRHPGSGKYYLGGPVGSCREASIVAELTGLGSTRRLPDQPLAFSAGDRDAAVKFQATQAAQKAADRVLAIARAPKPLGAGEGSPDWGVFDFSDRRTAQWNFDARHAATATWSYDDRHLYLGLRSVRDETPMVNGGADPQMLFKTGDAVEFELRTAADNESPQVIAGDIRLLISVFQGKPIAVLYRYKVPGTAAPVTFSSPVGTTKIDQVVVLASARIAIDRGNNEYHLRAAIPLKDLGFAPAKDKTYRGDFGVVYSDKAGRIDELRMYWANPSNAMVNDVFSEAAISPAAWGRFKVEE